MDGNQLSHTLSGGSTGICCSFHGTDIAPDHDGDVSAPDLFLTDEVNTGRLDHGVCRLDGAHEATGFHHAQCNSVIV